MASQLSGSRPVRAVIDPTILIGALLDSKGDCARLLDHVARHQLQLVLDESVRDCLAAALQDEQAQDQGKWDASDARRWINALEVLAVDPQSLKENEAGLASQGQLEKRFEALDELGGPSLEDRVYFDLAAMAAAVLVSTDPYTLRHSGHLGVDVVKPETLNSAIEARLRD